jgi:hypothetical protein
MKADTKDLVGGGILVVIGVYVFFKSMDYSIGVARQMGPGFYPMVVSALLVILGALIIGLAFLRTGTISTPDWRSVFAVIGSVLVFALSISSLGLMPAVFATTFVCAAGHRGWNPLKTLILAIFLCITTWVVFSHFLGLSMPALVWPVLIL